MRRFLLLFALIISAPAQAEWWEARTDHFVVYSESSSRDAKAFAETLERFDTALRGLQGIGPDEQLSDVRRLTVFRFGKISDIASLAGSEGVAGFYIPRGTGPVAFVPARRDIGRKRELDAMTILQHEYGHHFMFRNFAAAYPTWYVEAFAEVNSTIEFMDDGSFKLGAPPQSRADALSGGLHYSIKRLLLSGRKPEWEDVYARYTYGWLLLHYLSFEPSRKGQVQTYLRLINNGTDPAAAARQAFGDLDALERDVMAYKSKNRFPGVLAKPSNFVPPTVTMRRLGPDEEAIMRIRMRSERGVNKKTAPDVARDARAIAARFPSSVPVLLALVEAEFDADQYAEADKAADEALRLAPSSAKALLYKGMIAAKRAKQDASQYEVARSWFEKAAQADREHPGPLIQYYLTYKGAGQPAPTPAIQALEYAFELAPYDSEARVLLSRQLLMDRKPQLARTLLQPLALSPHESKSARALNEVAELIDSGSADEALTKLNAWMDEREKEREGKKSG